MLRTFVSPENGNPADAMLCYRIRSFGHLKSLLIRLEEVLPELKLVDQAANHDDILPPEVLAAIKECDSQGELRMAELEMQRSLASLQKAHGLVEGLFRGSLKDDTEEAISRLAKLMEARLQQFHGVVEGYQKPQRPHEIRRETLSQLIVQCNELVEKLSSDLCAGLPANVSADLVAELNLCRQEIERMPARLRQLRERSSQKMAAHIQQCFQEMIRVHLRITAVEEQARERSGCVVLHDPRVRNWSESLLDAA